MSEVENFLDLKMVAIVGMSRDPKELSRLLVKPLTENGMEIIPVHPEANEIDGMKCFKSVCDISPTPDGALVIVNKDKFKVVVDDCIEAGIKNVWLYGVTGPKSINEDLQRYCLENGINLIAGFCPFMFMDNVETGHKIHSFIWKMIGFYPKK